ncbi:MAG: amidohydrolase [Bacteroidota bacterium]|nr:amidohydrolase [Bacteroidota bacterium]
MMKYFTLSVFLSFSFITCYAQKKENADRILIHGTIYTVDKKSTVSQALAIKEGKILATGTDRDILRRFSSDSILDLGGKAVFPGFIDGHSHFTGYALSLREVNVFNTRSFSEVLNRLSKKSGESQATWIVGRGWDQNLWKSGEFPDRSVLDSMFPHRPVVLIRVCGHVLLANGEALKRAGIIENNGFQAGEVEIKEGRLTGILRENAADRMRNAIPEPDIQEKVRLLESAQYNCFAAGLTGVTDAGLEARQVRTLDSLDKDGDLDIRLYIMLAPSSENLRTYVEKGPVSSHHLNIRAIKLYADGSLGSRSALLKSPYSDDPGNRGIRVTTPDSIRRICKIALLHGYQVNTHAIGDSAVQLVLDVYKEFLKGKNDLRWRIEHSQVVDPEDFNLFGDYSVIPSVQATHATSDMRWASARLGEKRISGAYAYKRLLMQNGWLVNGTDFPIEKISPLLTFYAAVSRQDTEGYPAGGFMPENALTREEALRSITLWAAKGEFEEKVKGSLEPGKMADFVVLDKDIMKIPVIEIPQVRVLKTFLEGKEVYSMKYRVQEK